ncbi:MAG: alternative oxidase [Burkholderiales bacterium]|nr:alternative oxidase [Burkholderiales bacterium]
MKITHRAVGSIHDVIAYSLVKFFRFLADVYFGQRYVNRAIMLETVAAAPGMVAGWILHFRCLRRFKNDDGWINKLYGEAENEKMHLIIYLAVGKANLFERFVIYVTQFVFTPFYFLMYMLSKRTAHRFVGYLEEEAVVSYVHFLKAIDDGKIENISAPQIAIDYWKLDANATLRDVVIATGLDECHHRDVNHEISDYVRDGNKLLKNPF